MRRRVEPKSVSARRGRAGRLRIIGGEWARRQLPVVDAPGLRPTADRMRETLFNWLQAELAGAQVLDLFAGSGALGLEALSRGAARAVLIERHPRVARQLQDTVRSLGAAAEVRRQDALQYLQRERPVPFDGVFVDPPFDLQLQEATLRQLARGWVRPGSWIYVEQPVQQPVPDMPAGWRLWRERVAGAVRYLLYDVDEVTDET